MFSDSWKKAHQNSLRLLSYVEDTSKAGLGGFQLGLLVFAGGAVFGERVFDFRHRRVAVERLLQRFLFLTGWRPKPTSAIRPWTTWATRPPRPAWTAQAHVSLSTRVHQFLNQWLNHGPFGVIGDAQVSSDVVNHTLAKLGRVEIASRSAVARTSRAASRIAWTAAIVILSVQIPAAQA